MFYTMSVIQYFTRLLRQKNMKRFKNEYENVNAVQDILESQNTYEKILKFKSYGDRMSNCRIFLFDEEFSNFDSSFKNQRFGQCEVIGVGDYTKTWILDSNHISDNSLVLAGKTIDFDLNILSYLNRIMVGRKINIDEKTFMQFLNYLKTKGFQYGIMTALMERVKTPINLNILSEMITSFVKFDNMPLISEDCADFYLSPDDYIRIKDIYDTALSQTDEKFKIFDALCCCVMKAFLIKNYEDGLDKEEKVEKFIKFCLDDLNCYLEKEIVILSLYIKDDSRTHKTFKKLKGNPDIIKNILNVTWDIYHIRLLEQIMFLDNIKNRDLVILSYFATADNGIIDAMKINPIKAFAIIDDYSISIHQMNIENICNNKELLEDEYYKTNVRANKIKSINFSELRQKLEHEILEFVK